MDQPSGTGTGDGSRPLIPEGRSPALTQGSIAKRETLKPTPQTEDASTRRSKDGSIENDLNSETVVKAQAVVLKPKVSSAVDNPTEVSCQKQPAITAKGSTTDGKQHAKEVPFSNETSESAKKNTKPNSTSKEAKGEKRSRDTASDKVKSIEQPLWFESAFKRVLNVASPGPATDALDAIVTPLLRQDKETESIKREIPPFGIKKKKMCKDSSGKRKLSTNREIGEDERQRKTVRTFDVEQLLDDDDLSSDDAEQGKPHAAETKNPPKLHKKSKGITSRVQSGDAVAKRKSQSNQKKIARAKISPMINHLDFLQEAKEEISRAASLVARSLLQGLWPSPYRSLEPARIYSRTPSEYSAHREHMYMAGVAIEKFAHEIVSPAIIEEMQHSTEEGRSEPRAYLATLLYLREVLVLNAATIFGPSAFVTGQESDFRVIRSTHDNSLPAQDAAILSVKTLVTAVIIDGLHKLGIESRQEAVTEEVTTKFLDMCEKYDLGDREFAGCLSRATDEVVPFNPSRKKLPEMERKVWRACSNFQRHHHPLVSPTQTQVKPSAVHIVAIGPSTGKTYASLKKD